MIDALGGGVLSGAYAGEEAAEYGAIHGACGLQQGHGGQGGWVNRQTRLAESLQTLHALRIILTGAETVQAGGVRTWTLRVLWILGPGLRVLRIIAVRRLAVRVLGRISVRVRRAILRGIGRRVTGRRGAGGIIVEDGRAVWRLLRICAGCGVGEGGDRDTGLTR